MHCLQDCGHFVNHFKHLAGSTRDNTQETVDSTNQDNQALYEHAILYVLSKSKRNKCPGIDGLLYEFFVECKDIMIPILNNRLLNVTLTYSIRPDAQFGFKSGFSTVDAIFPLQSVITITLGSNKLLYCAFIDYSKAFDTVEHKTLWLKIYKLGLNSKLINVVKSMYCQIKSCVKYKGNIGLSESFWYKSGLIKGEALSPFLFFLFVNEQLNNTDRLYQINVFHLCLLMYADDTVLFSKSVSELQRMLDTLFIYTTKWNLTVNIKKVKSWYLEKVEM